MNKLPCYTSQELQPTDVWQLFAGDITPLCTSFHYVFQISRSWRLQSFFLRGLYWMQKTEQKTFRKVYILDQKEMEWAKLAKTPYAFCRSMQEFSTQKGRLKNYKIITAFINASVLHRHEWPHEIFLELVVISISQISYPLRNKIQMTLPLQSKNFGKHRYLFSMYCCVDQKFL